MATEAPAEGETGNSNESKVKHKRKMKEKFIYGNYRAYYGYRIDPNIGEDPRLEVFRKEWFEGKDCLDIGCNQGLMTIAVARKFLCRSILGVDIDADLIEAALCNLRNISRRDKAAKKANLSSSPQSKKTSNGTSDLGSAASPNTVQDLSEVVSFHCENIIQGPYAHGKYDTILCLSVTKWIHLNWGDDGLVDLFAKAWRLLRPGGILILEPQSWSSYRRNRRVSEAARRNFDNILIHPNKFREILLDKIGFRSAEIITDRLSGTAVGFERPITVYYK